MRNLSMRDLSLSSEELKEIAKLLAQKTTKCSETVRM